VLVLGIDTSGRQGSVALLRVQDGQLVTLDLTSISGGNYSELLVSTIAGLLVRHSFERHSIGLIGVASGPGSFTGLRIAIATAKGLAEAFDTPVVAVSVLETVALTSGVQGRVIAALDAQRSEVFFGDYVVSASSQESAHMAREGLASFGNFTSMFAVSNPPVKIFTPDDGLADRLRQAALEVDVLTRPSADFFARIAYRKFLAGVRTDVATLDANYLRRSDAEIVSIPKIGSAPR
jgi:tRNA threonylcarbamoyladenosine biosynthesis protein TsaB